MTAIISLVLLVYPISSLAVVDPINKPFPQMHRSVSGLTLEASSKNDVFQKMGDASPWPRPDKKHDPYYYCYQLSSSEKVWAIFGFGWAWSYEKFDSLLITQMQDDIKGPCASSSVTPNELRTEGGLSLGLKETVINKMIDDSPTKRETGYVYFKYDSYIKYPEPRKTSIDSPAFVGEYHYGIIELNFNKGILNRLYLWASGEPDW